MAEASQPVGRIRALTDVGLAADGKDSDDPKGPRAGGDVQARRHLQDARLPRRDSRRPVGVDPVHGW